jgi:hypothetical protein
VNSVLEDAKREAVEMVRNFLAEDFPEPDNE